ncbi:Oidioi.mRNA.OKI2018_I69.chr2.g5249.t1.cds [Oikopleura dioica]|uniref:Oidioi.mRNA.OKI2018_I69.chr2.g5249.t1.cds n=1 Tax=Oikopleura dioica TaxID=34765 RepID=A0ABN7T6G1_OIKDI|nr:Oidioi.mRNA.OKI2018_I69.chr2.g5249.t1.cds [Oikopleura dioica]
MTDKLATKIINDVTKIISSKKKSKLGDILSKLKSSPAFTAKEAEKLFAKFLVKELNTKRVRIPLEHIEDHVSNHKDDFGSGLVQAVREEPVRVQKSSEEPYLLENQEAPHSSKNLPTVLTKNVEASEQMLFMPQEVGILSKSTIEHLDADVRLEKISRASREEEGSVEQNQEQELNIQPRSILKKNKTTNSEEDDSDPDWIDENPAERLELEKENLIGALEEIASTSSVPSILEALSTLKTTEEIKSEMQNLSEQNQNTLIKMQLLPSEIMKNMLDKSTWKNENVILKAPNLNKMGAVSSAPSDLSDYDEDPTEATLIYETVNLNDVKNESIRPGSGKNPSSSQQEDKYKKQKSICWNSVDVEYFQNYLQQFNLGPKCGHLAFHETCSDCEIYADFIDKKDHFCKNCVPSAKTLLQNEANTSKQPIVVALRHVDGDQAFV